MNIEDGLSLFVNMDKYELAVIFLLYYFKCEKLCLLYEKKLDVVDFF